MLFTILLPLARSGIMAGAALAFVSAIGNFGIQAMLGIPARFPTLITLIYQQLNSYGPPRPCPIWPRSPCCSPPSPWQASALPDGCRGAGISGSMGSASRSHSPRQGPHCCGSRAWIFLALTLLLPLSALVTTSLVSGFGQELTFASLTLENYANALLHHASIRDAFFTSFGLTLAATLILVVMAVFLAYFLSWHKGPVVRLVQLAAELAYALPGIVLGVAMILFFLKPLPFINVSIYGTVWIILAAYLSNFLALALRPVLGGFAQIERSLEEAGRVAGAGFLARMKDIILPVLAPSAIAGGIIVFMTALNEIQVSILLVSSGARTIGPMIVFLEEGGSSTLAAAVGCLMVVVILLLMGTASLFSSRLPKGALPWQDRRLSVARAASCPPPSCWKPAAAVFSLTLARGPNPAYCRMWQALALWMPCASPMPIRTMPVPCSCGQGWAARRSMPRRKPSPRSRKRCCQKPRAICCRWPELRKSPGSPSPPAAAAMRRAASGCMWRRTAAFSTWATGRRVRPSRL
ncbi:ABC transporter permease subunit [Pannonibacter sp. Pt2-lr]